MAIENGLKTIKTLFDGSKKFRIPEFQRSYAWEKKQLDEFFYDLHYQLPEQKYFYGTVLLSQSREHEDFEILDIVDGQQRLTTLVIFISILIKKIKEFDDSYNFKVKEDIFIKYHGIHKLVQNSIDNDFFQNFVIKTNKEKALEIITSPSQRRLLFARTHLTSLLEKEKVGIDKLKILLKIIEKTEVLIYSVKDSAEATLIFETTNDRGKSLTNLEKLKSFMMYKCFLSNQPNSKDLIENIDSRFGEIYRTLEHLKLMFEQLGTGMPNEDQLCQYHFIGAFSWRTKKNYQEYLSSIKKHINELVKKHELEEANQFIDDFSQSLKGYFVQIKSLLSQHQTQLKEIIYLGKIAVFYPLIIKVFISNDRNEFSNLLQELTSFSFRIFGLKIRRTNDVDVFLNNLARDYNGNINTLLISIKKKQEDVSSISIVEKKLSSTFFYNEYGSEVKNYFFWKYENYLRENFQPKINAIHIDDLILNNEKYKPTIEHIQAKAMEWNEGTTDEEKHTFKEEFENAIGNLVLDPKSANSSKGKKNWKIKSEYYFNQSPLKSQLELKKFLVDDNWNSNAIDSRQIVLLKFARNNLFD